MGTLAGKGLAIAGICVSAVFLLISSAFCAYLMFIQLPYNIEQARANTTMANLKTLHSAVLQFYMDTGRYPTEEENLNALIEQPADVTNWNSGGYLETKYLPKDGWNHDFIYERLPESGKQFVIRSAGPDGEAGTDDDLLSTDTYSQWHR